MDSTMLAYDLVSRASWGAKPATDKRSLELPVPYVVIHHTYIPGACTTKEKCSETMRGMQDYHMGKGWGDIGYNFCVGSDGSVYEGRGWRTIGVHARRANNYSVCICIIGDWSVELPPASALVATKELMADGESEGFVSPTYKLMGARQVIVTESPGQALQDEISTWDHYISGRFVM